nr:MAG TPA: protein of unknown function DUF859 [Caudoviricetes sp.]
MATKTVRIYPPASNKYGYDLTITGYEKKDSWEVEDNTSEIYVCGTLSGTGTADFSTSSNHTLAIYYYVKNNEGEETAVFIKEINVKALGRNDSVSVEDIIKFKHNDDGSLNMKLGVKWIKSGTNNYVPVNGNADTDWFTCYTIPRASGISANEFFCEDGVTINISRASNLFYHNIYYQYEGTTEKKLLASGVLEQYNWNPNIEEFYKYITNSNLRGYLTLYCETFVNYNKIGESQVTCVVKMKEYEPTLKITSIKDINEDTIKLTGDENKIILNHSNVAIKCEYSTTTGANITSYSITNGSQKINENPGIINEPANADFVITIVDSRNRSKTITKSMDIQEYVELAFKSWNIDRTESTSNKVRVDFKLGFFNGNFGSIKNILGGNEETNKGTIKVQYAETGSNDWIDLPDLIIDLVEGINEFNYSGYIDYEFDYQKSFQLKLSTNDKLCAIVLNEVITKGIPLIDKGEGFVDVHGEVCAHDFFVFDEQGNYINIIDYIKGKL